MLQTAILICNVTDSEEFPGFFKAVIKDEELNVSVVCYARDTLRAEGFAWRTLGELLISKSYEPK